MYDKQVQEMCKRIIKQFKIGDLKFQITQNTPPKNGSVSWKK